MPILGTIGKTLLTYGDRSQESANMEFFTVPLTVVNFEGQNTLIDAVVTATEALALGNLRAKSVVSYRSILSNAWSTDPNAHRENKLLVQYRDNVTEEVFTLTIPTIDSTKLNLVPGGGDSVIFSGAGASAEIVAWVTAFQAVARNPRSSVNTNTVVGMRFIGVNS
jgi:hypothetical protein